MTLNDSYGCTLREYATARRHKTADRTRQPLCIGLRERMFQRVGVQKTSSVAIAVRYHSAW